MTKCEIVVIGVCVSFLLILLCHITMCYINVIARKKNVYYVCGPQED